MTTPVTSPEEQSPMTGELTSQWVHFLGFLRGPRLPERAIGPGTGSLAATLRLLGLDFALMFVLLAILFIAIALGLEVPETALANIELTPAIIALVVIGAPLAEELVFRSWLSGRPGHVLGVLAIAVGALGFPFVGGLTGAIGSSEAGALLLGGFGLVTGIGLAIFALRYFRRRGPMRWFASIFPVILPLSALAFASVHLFNYEEEISLILWLFVLPQFILGLICGYARVQFGLWSAILLHALHNGTIMALVLTFEGLGGA